jgi:hypothetical protein
VIGISRDTLKRLGLPAGVAFAFVAVGLGALVVTGGFADRAAGEFASARADRMAIQTRLSQVTDEEREIQARLVDYQNLRARGVLGEERRLDWVETIKQIKLERRLYDVRYSIEPRRALDYPGVKAEAGVDLLMSRVKLEASLLHEEDLFNLIDDLRQRLAPVVVVRSCSINRTERSRVVIGSGPRLRSECVIDLVTMRDTKEAR